MVLRQLKVRGTLGSLFQTLPRGNTGTLLSNYNYRVTTLRRNYSSQEQPRPSEHGQKDSTFRTWGLAANKVASFAIIPTAILYAVFFADWGDHEHVFMPARRWLLRRKADFYTLSPAEQELVRPKEPVKVVKFRDSSTPTPDISPDIVQPLSRATSERSS